MPLPSKGHTPTKPILPKGAAAAAGSAIHSVRNTASRNGTKSSAAYAAGGAGAGRRGSTPLKNASRLQTPSTSAAAEQQQQSYKNSRAAALKLEMSGAQKIRQLVELLHDPATSTQYAQHVAGVVECLECFPDGFTPLVAQDGIGQLVAGLVQVVSTEAAGSEALVPALLDIIAKCASPIVYVTLEDQHLAEGAMRALCTALCAALTAPVGTVRVAAAVGLHKIFAATRALAGDDLMSPSERREMGEVAAWKQNVRRSATLEVLQGLCACWEDTASEEIERLRKVAEQVAVADAVDAMERRESDDEKDGKKERTAAARQKQQMQAAGGHSGYGSSTTKALLASSQSHARAADTVRELDDNARRIARSRDSSSVANNEMVAILKAVREISAFAPQCAHLVLDCGACRLLLRTLSVCERGDRRVAMGVEILWNLLTLCPDTAAHCCDVEMIGALYQTFVECLSVGYKQKERELRNDLIVVVTAISEAPEAASYLGPFAEVLLELSCGNEKHNGRSESPFINPKNHYTLSNEDQQAKTLAWGFLAKLTLQSAATAARLAREGDAEGAEAAAGAAATVLEWGFVDVLISYLDVHCEQPAVVRWSTPQLLDLQEQALLILTEVAETGWEHFLRCNAPSVLHSYIAECPDTQLRNLAMTLVARLAVTDAKASVAESGAVPVAVQLLAESDDDALSLECLNLLADIVNREPAQQHLFLACGGVQAVLPRLVFSPTYHTNRREEVVLSAFDCCWSCVFGNVDCERAFIRAGGVPACLLALETIRFESSPFILSALADLFTNKESIPEVRSWRSPRTGKSGVQLFIDLWRKASAVSSGKMMLMNAGSTSGGPAHRDPNTSRLGIVAEGGHTTPSASGGGDLRGQQAPSGLNSDGTPYHSTTPHTSALASLTAPRNHRQGQVEVSEAAAEMTKAQSTHIKLYACMSCVGFADHRELSPGERATLSHMEVFEHLCNDLAWAAVNASLQAEQVVPIASDRAKLDGVLAEGAARKVALDTIQELYRKEEQQRVADREAAFYKTIIKKTDEELPPGVVTCGMTITQAKICKSQMLKESVMQAQAHQHAKAVEKARSVGLNDSSQQQQQQQQQQGATSSSSGALSFPAASAGASGSLAAAIGNSKGSTALLAAGDDGLLLDGGSSSAGGAAARGGGEGQKAMTDEEYAVLKLLNTVRTDPESFIPTLQRKAEEISALLRVPGQAEAQGITEGTSAVEEAISVLHNARRIVTFLDVPMGMLFATRDHAADLKSRMDVSPNSHDGATPLQRLMRYGTVPQKSVLLQVVGKKSAEEVIAQLIVDDGVPSRVDRRNLLDPEMRCASVSIAPHPFHHTVYIIAMAYEYIDKPREQQHDVNRKVHAKMRSSVL